MPDHVVAFPEKLLKTIATRCAIFSLKFAKKPFGGRAPSDPLGSLSAPPDQLAAIGGLLLREGEGEEKEKRGEMREGGKELEREGGRGGEGKGGKENGKEWTEASSFY